MKPQQKIILMIMVGMLIGFSAFLSINYLMMYKITSNEINNKLINESINLTTSIEAWLDDKLRIAIALAKQAQKLEDRSTENVRRYLHLVNDSADIDASMIYYKGKPLIHTQHDWILSPKQEEANMPYQTMLKNGFKPTLSRVFKSPINKVDNMIAAIAPFDNDSIATLVVEIRDVENKVSKTKIDGGFAVLIDKDRNTIVSPNDKIVDKKISDIIPELKWLEDKIFSTHSGLLEYSLKDKPFIILYDTINATGWKVLIILDKNAAFADLNAQTKKMLLLSLCFFIIGTIFIILMNKLHEYWRKDIEKKKRYL